jgi:hypothetical protein
MTVALVGWMVESRLEAAESPARLLVKVPHPGVRRTPWTEVRVTPKRTPFLTVSSRRSL